MGIEDRIEELENKTTELEEQIAIAEHRIKELEEQMAIAYGLLWHVVTRDGRVWAARRILLEVLPDGIRKWGIEEVKKQGIKVNIPKR